MIKCSSLTASIQSSITSVRGIKLKYNHTFILSRANYHSFPDQNEKPKITSFRSNFQKLLNKSTMQLDLDSKFKTNILFPGLPVASSSIKPLEPETKVTTLSNGLRIASEDKYSLMTSICFVVKAGRFVALYYFYDNYLFD